MKIFFKQKNKGFTLVETLVAVSIFTMSLLGIMSVLASSIADTTYAKQKMTATYLAQEGIEYMRNMRDTNMFFTSTWSDFIAGSLKDCTLDDKCGFNKVNGVSPYSIANCSETITTVLLKGCELFIDSTGLYDSMPDISKDYTDSGFTRTIWMTGADGSSGVSAGDNEVRIYSEVSWTTGSGLHKITFSENLFNWWYVVK
jgi:Tfp pilus assembly protein PilV